MPIGIEEILREATKLSRRERWELVRLLLDLDRRGTSDIETAWDEEIRARVRAVDEGTAVGIRYEQVKKEVADRFP